MKINRKPCLIVITMVIFLSSQCHVIAQTATEILRQSIQYHDPHGAWQQFKGVLNITMETPGGSDRNSRVTINRNNGHFEMKVKKDGMVVDRSLKNEKCDILLNGSAVFTDEDRAKYGLTCERTKMYRNYYSYLYGMPMKIKDDGAHLDTDAEQVTFMGKSFWKLKVTYEASVGSDTWYFYFNTETYALEAYQFFHDEQANDGEYILLDDEIIYKGIRIPKVRNWYMNADDKYLGVDILNSVNSP